MSLLSRLRVVVVGGGLSGLVSALSLRALGCSRVSLFEEASSAKALQRERAGGRIVQPNGVRVMDALELSGPLYSKGALIDKFSAVTARGDFVDAFRPGGAVRDRVKGGMKLTSVASSFEDVHQILLDSLLKEAKQPFPSPSPSPVHFARRVSAVVKREGHYTVKFEDGGEEAEADLIVAADGINSSMRRNAVQSGPAQSDVQTMEGFMATGLTPTRSLKLAPDHANDEMIEVWGKGMRFSSVTLKDGREWWYATCHSSFESKSRDGPSLASLFVGFPKWVISILENCPAETYHQAKLQDLPPSTALYNGGVVLVGSAASSLAIDHHQQTSQTLESGIVLALCLHEHNNVVEALRTYQRIQWNRLNNLYTSAHSECASSIVKSGIMSSIRDMATSLMPKQVAHAALESAVKYNVFQHFSNSSSFSEAREARDTKDKMNADEDD